MINYSKLFNSIRKDDRLLVIVATAHKVGSTWIYQLLQNSCHLITYSVNQNILKKNEGIPAPKISLEEIIQNPAISSGRYIHKSHAFPIKKSSDISIPDWIKLVTVIRDPRDVIISASHYLAWLPEENGGWGENYKNLNEKTRIKEIILNGEFLWSRLDKWSSCPDAHKVRYENIISNGMEELNALTRYLDIYVNEKLLTESLNKFQFENISDRKPGDEDKGAFLRKGIAGDWKNYFTEEIKESFKNAHNGRWNKLLIKLGYEHSMDW